MIVQYDCTVGVPPCHVTLPYGVLLMQSYSVNYSHHNMVTKCHYLYMMLANVQTSRHVKAFPFQGIVSHAQNPHL